MNAPKPSLSRRSLFANGGALVLSFSLFDKRAFAQSEEAEVVETDGPLPGSLDDYPFLDAWIRIGADESVTVFTGKAELGQGIKTALAQVAAEQLDVDPARVALQTADTDLTPDEGYTAASHSMEESGTAIMHAAAEVRALLLDRAAERTGARIDRLRVEDGVVVGEGGRLTYGSLVGDEFLHVRASGRAALKEPGEHTVMGRAMPRTDIPTKLTGGVAYVQDLRLPGMVHARVVRPPVYGAKLAGLDSGEIETMPGVLKVVRDGDYLAVVAEGEYQAIEAMQALREAAEWRGGETLPRQEAIYDVLRDLPAETTVIHEAGDGGARSGGGRRIEATYRRPYQMHGSIGPSCAVGHLDDGRLTVWSHTQGVYPDRKAIAEMTGMDEADVRVIHMEGAGCYGHNGADDAAADAALVARALPGRPVRVQWMREDEHQWEPYGSAMVVSAGASIDESGNVDAWTYDVWSTPHVTRPGPAGNLLPATLIANPFRPARPVNIPQPAGGADRNAVPGYDIANARVTEHFIASMPLRVSALRSLGAYMNVFALESFMDELCREAGADPVRFRLDKLADSRARDVVTTAAEAFGWDAWKRQGPAHGRGFAYARYKNLAAYCAVALELEVLPESGQLRVLRTVAASDSGQVVNPDGIRNQIEGGVVQSTSWTLYEEVRFSTDAITSLDWDSYPIMRFPAVPGGVEVHVVDRPGAPFLGTGEASQGPTAAAIANAFADATGVRLRDLPFSPERVQAALQA